MKGVHHGNYGSTAKNLVYTDIISQNRKSDFYAKMANPVLLLPQSYENYNQEDERTKGKQNLQYVESWRADSPAQLCGYEKPNPKVAVRKAENQPNLCHRNLKRLMTSSTSYFWNCRWKVGIIINTWRKLHEKSDPCIHPIPLFWQESSSTLISCMLWRG